ncbi:DUF6602 domain-containing protein [Acetobacter senegalensis]|uniref:DUF6602 domain-containing protein n=1 Tax=Acetobacter senegalensis TaxID=446692 RepID=A0A0U5EVF2_9PROT|nr:DUF6602 domain-containing protein [Acetobacter senegalensis]MCG4258696.1 hypothetical protein [Acetobacter senegalensis]MCG4268610.1 hypothetical protein [Acetobacter senegalensis]CEF41705.1 hypothetical protein ASN_2415 [Acetobacter senegalensis]
MDGKRLQAFWNQEVKSLLAVYRQFETLLPNSKTAGAEHRGEDGRYVETLLRSYLQKYLPKDLEVLTGFILRPAVKLGDNNRSRSKMKDLHTTQLDIIIYDSGTYPVFQRMVDTVIVPPEGVIAVLSVKKTLRDTEIQAECNALLEASQACRCDEVSPECRRRGPFLALVATASDLADKQKPKEENVFEKLQTLYGSGSVFDDMIGFVGDLSGWHVFKARPPARITSSNKVAKYMYVELDDDELHQGFQYILSGILSVYYDKTRSGVKRPGYTAFASKPASMIGKIAFTSLR